MVLSSRIEGHMGVNLQYQSLIPITHIVIKKKKKEAAKVPSTVAHMQEIMCFLWHQTFLSRFQKSPSYLSRSINCCRDTAWTIFSLFVPLQNKNHQTKLVPSPSPLSERFIFAPFLFLALCLFVAIPPSHRMASKFICTLVFMTGVSLRIYGWLWELTRWDVRRSW